MSKTETKPSQRVEADAYKLVSLLERWHRDEQRGPLARLRRGLSEATRQDAWSMLGPWFGEKAVNNRVFETVAGCYALHPLVWADNGNAEVWSQDRCAIIRPKEWATHPKDDAKRNLGWTYRQVMPEEKMEDDTEPHTRFRRLLACGAREEICEHVRHAIRLAKSKEVAVNYRQLFVDLWWWENNDRAKVSWAKAYWAVPTAPAGLGAYAGMGDVGDDTEPAPESTDE